MVFFSEGSLGPFSNNLNDLIVKRFAIPYGDAGKLLIIPFFLTNTLPINTSSKFDCL